MDDNLIQLISIT